MPRFAGWARRRRMPSSRHSRRSIPCPRERVPDERRFPLVPTTAAPQSPARGARRVPSRLSLMSSSTVRRLRVPASWTILEACRSLGIDTPTLCYLENLTPVNVCRICVVELTGARTLVPACSRHVEPGMDIKTDSPRVRLSRKMVLEFLGSSVDLSTAPQAQAYAAQLWRLPRALRPAATTGESGRARRPRGGPSPRHPTDASPRRSPSR